MNQERKRPSIFILIRSLHVGGAERQVSVLAKSLHNKGYSVTVGVFYSGGVLEEKLRQEGVCIYSLDKKGRWDLLGWFLRYLRAIRKVNPDIIYSFLTTSNIVAITGRLFVRKPVVWGIRASNMDFKNYDWLATLSGWVEKILSRYVKVIIFNSRSSRDYHESLGYRLNHAVVISNGIDTDVYKSDLNSRITIRNKLAIPEGGVVIGMLARVDPMKDYETYLTAARALCPHNTNLYFVAAGAGTDTASWTSLPSRFLTLGVWEDVPGLLNALDIMVLSSAFGEGFPNVIGEAMACGLPTIATDVGDTAYIVGDQGLIIPSKNPEALIQAIRSLLDQPPSKEGIRDRIQTNFSVSQMVDRTLQTLKEACESS
jgi:glycosyltransferase involved in cell wall biosynthesis